MNIDELLTRWAAAELAGAVGALDILLHDDFVAVGPAGFVLTKKAWLDRYATGGLRNDTLDWEGAEARDFGGTVIAVGAYTSSGKHQDRPIQGTFRTTHVVVGDQIAGIHISPRMAGR
jgi:hypothetical protein